jgi:tetratricopeptide (TPR) repeat protein
VEHLSRLHMTGDRRELDRAVADCRRAVALTPAGSPEYPERLSELGDMLSMTFDITRQRAFLEEALAVHQRAVESAPPGHPASVTVRVGMAAALLGSFQSGGPPEHLDQAMVLYEAAVPTYAPGDPLLAMVLARQSEAHGLRFMREGDVGDLVEAAEKMRQSIVATPADDDVQHLLRTVKYVVALLLVRDQPGIDEELTRALDTIRRGLPTLPGALGREVGAPMGPLLHMDHLPPFDAAQLEMSRTLFRAALDPEPELRAGLLGEYGKTIAQVAVESGQIEQVDNAIVHLRQALDEAPADGPQRAALLAVLGGLLGMRIEWTSELDAVDEMIEVLREAVAVAPPDDENRWMYLSNLGNGLNLRYSVVRRDDLLDEVIDTYRQAIEQAPGDHADRPAALSNLGTACFARFERWGHQADLDDAVGLHRAACEATPVDHANRPLYLGNLGGALTRRFRAQGHLADIDDAVVALRESIALTSESHVDRGGRLAALGLALLERYSRTGQKGSLDAAVATLREADRVTPPGHMKRWGVLVDLGLGLSLLDTPASRDEAIELLRETTQGAPAGSHDRRRAAMNLALILLGGQEGLLSREDLRLLAAVAVALEVSPAIWRQQLEPAIAAHGSRRAEEVDEAVDLLAQTVDEMPEQDPDHPTALGLLAVARQERSQVARRPDVAELDAAIGLLRDAVGGSPEGSPTLASSRYFLARGLRDRWERTGHEPDRQEAVEQFRDAVAVETASPSWRASIAQSWGELVADSQGPAAATEAFAAAVGLLDAAAWRGLDRHDQERILSDFGGLASDAAACALAAGDPERAVELLEQGRGVLLAQVIDARPRYDEVSAVAPLLADRLSEIQDTLDLPDTAGPAGDHEAAEADRLDRRYRLARRRDEILAEIRSLPGLAEFLLPPPFPDLRAAAERGPVVVVNVSRYRCDALVVTAEGVTPVPLPELSAESITSTTKAFLAALDAYAHADDPDELAPIGTTLDWLAEAIGRPVLGALGLTEPPASGDDTGGADAWPHIWWCPTGTLSFLPLHAVALDVAVSSYTPTLRALIHARDRRSTRREGGRRPLVVALPSTPDQDNLPGAKREAEAVRRLLPEAEVLVGADATHDAVVQALPGSACAHFACHGQQDLAAPSEGRLELHDGPLTVRELTASRLDSANFAFLSGCETSRGGEVLADECISLAASLQLAGYGNVIGTLWPISDLHAPAIVEDVYAVLTDGGTREPDMRSAAFALHRAVRRLRAPRAQAPLLWAPFVHIGP